MTNGAKGPNRAGDPGLVERLLNETLPRAKGQRAREVLLGLGYTAVALEQGDVGICWSPKAMGRSCTVFHDAGTLAGRPAADLVAWLTSDSPWHRAIAIATTNALWRSAERTPSLGGDTIALLALQPTDRVAMVGRFEPLIPAIRATGATLSIVEREPQNPDELTPEAGKAALQACSVAIITGTSLVTASVDDLMASLGKPRAAVLLGPTTPLVPRIFVGSPITHLAGALVVNGPAALRIVSEGGGTPLLRPYLEFVCLAVPPR